MSSADGLLGARASRAYRALVPLPPPSRPAAGPPRGLGGDDTRRVVASLWSGMAMRVAINPFDVVTTRAFAAGAGTADPARVGAVASHVWRTHGVRGFFYGLRPNVIQGAVAQTNLLATGHMYGRWFERRGLRRSTGVYLGGLLTGLPESVGTNFHEINRVLRAMGRPGLDAIPGWRARLLAARRGFVANAARSMLANATFLGGAHQIRTALAGDEQPRWWQSYIAGSISGSVAGVLINPIEVLKTRMMAQACVDHTAPSFETYGRLARAAWRADGLRLFARGGWLRVARCGPVGMGVALALYEQAYRVLTGGVSSGGGGAAGTSGGT